MTTTDQWSAFEREVLEMAETIRQVQAAKYADRTPADVARDLDAIDKALTAALQVLGGLDLEHENGQDIEAHPYNWPVAMDLAHEASYSRWKGGEDFPANEWGQYPTSTIRAMREFRDAARVAAATRKPKRGNSPDRTIAAKEANDLGKNFVFRFRRRFGHMPPMSKTGPVVDLLCRALEAAGLDDVDSSDVLRRSIERDQMRDLLQPAASQIRKQASI